MDSLNTTGLMLALKDYPTENLWYLGSVYSKCPWGLDVADKQAKMLGARLFAIGITNFFCPIAHCHDMAVLSDIDKTSHELWMAIDQRFIDRCDGMIVPLMENWEKSSGLTYEGLAYAKQNKPDLYWDYRV